MWGTVVTSSDLFNKADFTLLGSAVALERQNKICLFNKAYETLFFLQGSSYLTCNFRITL
ncbi:hypothetical protein EXD76_04200 [BEV proteobacterium]|nr:hypothetical protein [Candidatus Symbiopectobacterium sp. Chty_BC]